MTRALVIGGTVFVGPSVVRELVVSGHDVAIFHRGEHETDLPAAVRHIHGDRASIGDHRDAFRSFEPQVVVDMRSMTERDEQRRFYTLWKRMVDDRPAILMSAKSAAFRASRTHVDNAAHAVVVAATDDRARGRVYNVGEPDALTWMQWARLVASQLRWTGELVVAPSEQMPTRLRDSRPDTWDHHLVAETSRIRQELGYRELVGRDEGLARALGWYAESAPADPAAAASLDYSAEDEALVTIRGSAVL